MKYVCEYRLKYLWTEQLLLNMFIKVRKNAVDIDAISFSIYELQHVLLGEWKQ